VFRLGSVVVDLDSILDCLSSYLSRLQFLQDSYFPLRAVGQLQGRRWVRGRRVGFEGIWVVVGLENDVGLVSTLVEVGIEFHSVGRAVSSWGRRQHSILLRVGEGHIAVDL
jgi:hypothetical protein